MSEMVNTSVYKAVLKEHYTDQHVENMTYKNNPFYALVEKDEKFGGKYHPIPIQWSDNQSRSRDFATAQTKSKTQYSKYESFFIDSVENYQVARIPTKSILQSQGDVAAFLPIAVKEIDAAINNLTRDLAVGQYRSGFGDRGQIASGFTVAGSTTIEFENPSDITNFEVGMELVAATTQGASTLKALGSDGNGLIVTKVNRRIGEEAITLSAAIDSATAGIPTIAAGDYLFQIGDRENSATPARTKITGIAAWVPTSSPASNDNFWGVNRSVDTRLYGQYVDGRGMPIEEVMEDLDAICCREGATPDYCLMNPYDFKAFKKAVGSRVVLVNVKANAEISFQGIEIASQKGTITVIPDQNCPSGLIYLLQLDTWKFYSMGKAVRCIDLDGLSMLRINNADGVEIRYGSYSQLGCKAPGWNGVALIK